MAKPMILPAALLAVLALGSLPLMAQDSTTAPRPAPAADAGFRLDLGAGRSLRIDCGATAIDACLAAAGPVIDKLAATPPVMSPMGGKGDMGKHGKKGHGKGHGKDHRGPEGKGGPGDMGQGAGAGPGKGPGAGPGACPEGQAECPAPGQGAGQP